MRDHVQDLKDVVRGVAQVLSDTVDIAWLCHSEAAAIDRFNVRRAASRK
jgi:hypothetical protein